jgi:hypothetical protein
VQLVKLERQAHKVKLVQSAQLEQQARLEILALSGKRAQLAQ